jgi:galactose mutarotase-like enzyme
MYSIQNKLLKVLIDEKGAELKSVFHQEHSLEYMWSSNPAYWSKTSPVLFPIVGTLKENTYQYKNQRFQLSRHGFARDKKFSVTGQTENAITFSLKSTEETMKDYPFLFLFSIVYTVEENELAVKYSIQNEGKDQLLFSVGGHPAFKLPLVDGTTYDDYKLVFEKPEHAGRWPISKDGLIEKEPLLLLEGTNELPLTKGLFKKDAIVLKQLQSAYVQLASTKTPHGLRFHFAGFPFLGLWAAPGADFLCIEPWCGIADSVDSDQEFSHKEGINFLAPGEEFQVQWKAAFL